LLTGAPSAKSPAIIWPGSPHASPMTATRHDS
jgi:hypothetical protein